MRSELRYSISEYFWLPCTVYFHFSDSHVYGGGKDRPDGKTVTAERVERKQPEEFVISAEDLSNPFSVFGKQRTTATTAAEGATPKMLEEERRTNK